jgi:hypothetical protein|nr:MAG TPA: hypothetical protein [Caudoviricetes sp.]
MPLIAVSEFTFELALPADPLDGQSWVVSRGGERVDISPDLDEALYLAFLQWKRENAHLLALLNRASKVKFTISQRG